jgi:hypothetical protein
MSTKRLSRCSVILAVLGGFAGCHGGGLAAPSPEDGAAPADGLPPKPPFPDAAIKVPSDGPPLGADADSAGIDAGDVTTCVPGRAVACACTDGRAGAQICNDEERFSPCQCVQDERLTRLRNGFVGQWRGTVTTPWAGPYPVAVDFMANGHYSAHCQQPGCVAFYYGSDDDSPRKVYELQDIRSDNKGQGEITFWFSTGNTNRGELRSIALSADLGTLQFEAWKGDSGPLTFDLHRQ